MQRYEPVLACVSNRCRTNPEMSLRSILRHCLHTSTNKPEAAEAERVGQRDSIVGHVPSCVDRIWSRAWLMKPSRGIEVWRGCVVVRTLVGQRTISGPNQQIVLVGQ